jgi:hypothetical protein
MTIFPSGGCNWSSLLNFLSEGSRVQVGGNPPVFTVTVGTGLGLLLCIAQNHLHYLRLLLTLWFAAMWSWAQVGPLVLMPVTAIRHRIQRNYSSHVTNPPPRYHAARIGPFILRNIAAT